MAKKVEGLLKNGGIYKLYFTANPSVFYIGSSVSFSERMSRHKYLLKKGEHKNIYMQRLSNKFGVQNLVFETIEIISDSNCLIKREQFYINKLKPKMNILRVAGSCYGYKHTDKTKKYLSSINTGRKMTKEQNLKNSIAQTGNSNAKGAVRSDEFKKNLSLIKMKKVVDIESGILFDSIGHAAMSIGLKYQTLYAKLSNRNKNNTNLRLI